MARPIAVPTTTAIRSPCTTEPMVWPKASHSAGLVMVSGNTATMRLGRATKFGPQSRTAISHTSRIATPARMRTSISMLIQRAPAAHGGRSERNVGHRASPRQAAKRFSSVRPIDISTTPSTVITMIAA